EAIVRVGDGTDRKRASDLEARSGHAQLFDALANLLREDVRPGRVRFGQQHHELVAAIAGGRINSAHAVSNHRGDGPQDLVAVKVAEAVVDLLEPVEVHHQQSEATPGP